MRKYIDRLFSNGFFRNISWNFLGFFLPVVVAMVMIPVVMKHIGLERFGVLTLIIVLIGSLTLFDFGVTRSITHFVTKYKEDGQYIEMLTVIKTGWVIITAAILVISALFYFSRDWISWHFFNVSNQEIRNEVAGSMAVIGLCLPFVIAQTTFVGVMEAFGAFKKISIGKAPFSILMYLIPMGISFYSSSLFLITLSLCLLRTVMAVVFFIMMRSEVNKITRVSLFSVPVTKSIAGELVKYGGWISISNIMAPVMLYIDRFFVATIVGAGVFAYYTTPYEVVSRVAIVTVSVCGVLFPVLVSKIHRDVRAANSHFNKAMLGIFLVLIGPTIIGAFISHWFLSIWINPSFADHAWVIFSLFLFGYLVHGLVQPAFIWIQACGKPWINVACQIVDLVLYVIYLPWMTHHYGIFGAAVAWNIRMALSLVVLHTIRLSLYRRELSRSETLSLAS